MMNKLQTQIVQTLKTHKLTIDELCEEFKIEKELMNDHLETLQTDYHVDLNAAKGPKQKKLRYHINMLPDVGNVYFISGKDKEHREETKVASSDYHFASKFQLPKTWVDAMKTVEDAGITKVWVAGDLMDGVNIYRGHLENLLVTSVEDQTDMVAEYLSKFPNLEFWGIAGNHDYSYTKQNGTKPLAILEAKVDNFKNLGDLKADVIEHGIRTRLLHGASGRAYARSYPSQTYLRDYFGGSEFKDMQNMPNIILLGHYHTFYVGKDHGIFIVQSTSFQDGDNEYCIRRGLTGPNGLVLMNYKYSDGIIDEFSTKLVQPRIAQKEKGKAFAKTSINYERQKV